jgi:hypothetical protein
VKTVGSEEEELVEESEDEDEEDRLQAEVGGKKFPNDKQSGYTPKSCFDRLNSEDVDMASIRSNESDVEVSNNLENKAPTSEAGSQTSTDEAGRRG